MRNVDEIRELNILPPFLNFNKFYFLGSFN